MPPRKIADALCAHLDLTATPFQSVEAAGPGFLNFHLAENWYEEVLRAVTAEGDDYGKSRADRPERVMVEFVSANPTGPMHMGNARGGVIGDCVASCLALSGHEVAREFLINDAGNQVDKFARSLNVRYIQLIRGEDAMEFPEDGYHGDDVKELARMFYAIHGEAPLSMPEEQRLDLLSTFGLSQNIDRMKRDLARYKISYDRWFSESELHQSGYIAETMELLEKSGHTYEKDGALWLRSTDFGCDKDDVLRRANGFYTYFAADIAYHRDKLDRRGFDRAINVWGADHHGHVKRLQSALDALGLDGSHRLEIILMQLVRLTRDGEVVRMSKRTGKAITLSDLLDEIPVDAARYFFNARSPESQMEFDLGLAVRQDSENPVYYVQYAGARIHSVLRNLADAGVRVDEQGGDLSLLSSPSERTLVKTLALLPGEIRAAAESRDPSALDRYAETVAAAFHKFYTENRVMGAPEELVSPRAYLCRAAAIVLKNVLSAIGVDAPERM